MFDSTLIVVTGFAILFALTFTFPVPEKTLSTFYGPRSRFQLRVDTDLAL